MKCFSSPEDRYQALRLVDDGWVANPSAGSVMRISDGREGVTDTTVWLAMTELMAGEGGPGARISERAGSTHRSKGVAAAANRSTGTAGPGR